MLFDGIDVFRKSDRNGKTYYNSKDEFRARFKYSPGEIDSMALRMYLEFDTRERKQPKPTVAENAYDALYARNRKALHSRFRPMITSTLLR